MCHSIDTHVFRYSLLLISPVHIYPFELANSEDAHNLDIASPSAYNEEKQKEVNCWTSNPTEVDVLRHLRDRNEYHR